MKNRNFIHLDSYGKLIKTRRLILRPLAKNDYKEWLDAYSGGLPKQNKWDLEPRKAKNCSKIWFNKILRDLNRLAKADDYYRLYAFEKKTGQIVGQVDFDIYVRSTHQFANFGYQIFNRHWGNGFGKEAASKGLKFGFKDLKLNRLEAAINLDNKLSIKLARSIGMRKEGIKKRYWYENGKWTDHLVYVANPEDIGLKAQKPK
ncbi:MAG: GNAT family N-acetyltransferase [Bdellovibrionales bacterium]|nr:GNAT family N-acetyltransferase [Bdellovibrionales bacterium]